MRLISSLSQLAVLGLFSGVVAVGMPSDPVPLSTVPRPVAAHDTVVDLLAPGQVPGAAALVTADRSGAWARVREAAIVTVLPTAPTVRVTGASTVTTVTAPVVVVGVTWREGTGQGASVQYRSQQKGRWSAWSFVDTDPEHGPDPGSAEAKRLRAGSDPLVVTGATAVQVRTLGDGTRAPAQPQLMVVDPGASAEPSANLASASRPFIYSRASWGADERIRVGKPSYGAVKGAFVHHTVNANSYTAAQVPSIIRAIYAYHVKGRHWSDIGYNFLVDRFGRIWEGRYGGMDQPVIGAHTLNHNAYSFGASAIGNFDKAAVPSAVTAAFTRLIGWKAQVHQFNPAGISNISGHIVKSVAGHRDTFSTTCPGRYLYAKVPAIRSGAAALVRGLPSLSIARDVDHQNHGDVLATNANSDLLLYSGTGRGTMSAQKVLFRGEWGGVDLVAIAGDWDGNGTVDVVARKVSTGQLMLYPGNGFGGFKPVRVIGSGWGVFDALVAPGDWSGDGRPDLIGRTGDGLLRLYPGNGRGGFGSPRVIADGWSGTRISALGDWTRDGFVDLLGVDSSGLATIYPGARAGGFGVPVPLGSGWDAYVSVSALGDETSDTRTDLFVVDKLGVAWIGKSGPVVGKVTWLMQSAGWEAVSVYSG